MKIILRLKEGSDGILALRAARDHARDRPDWPSCVYSYANGENIFVKKNKTSYTAIESGYFER